jgi:Zn-dependent protease with chaperone function
MHSRNAHIGLALIYVGSALLLFALPAFSYWFAGHAERLYDEQFLEMARADIEADFTMSAEERAASLEFLRTFPPSVACADDRPELADYRAAIDEPCSDYGQFRLMREVASAALVLGLASVLFALACALASFLSREAQYRSFLVGWSVLKLAGAGQAILQGGLAFGLSYWMTALWFEFYSVKIVLGVGLLAAFGVMLVIKAIFLRPQGDFEVEGEVVAEADAPALWERIRALCAEVGTAAPDHLVAGIDDNFFVTESEVQVAGQRLVGRTLYISLSLLRILRKPEADAVLAHEMAHFLGGDTAHSRRLSPLLARFWSYLDALRAGIITFPIFLFMRAYFGLFELSFGRSQRADELAADSVAARVTQPDDVARALLKIGGYASYRSRIEEFLFQQEVVNEELGIMARVTAGFADYAHTPRLAFDLHEAITPHPFDSHPPLRERLENVGATVAQDAYAEVLLAPVDESWAPAIVHAAAIEDRLWKAYESRFAAAHELDLAHRYEPSNEAERELVEKYFPPVCITAAGGRELRMDFASVAWSDWDGPVRFEQIASATVIDRFYLWKHLELQLKEGPLFKRKRSIPLGKLGNDATTFLDAFARYKGRHEAMVAYRAERSAR